jgi:RNA polymerase primary sigma factor
MRELVITQQFTDRSDIQQYLNDINKIPMITPEEEVVLAQRIKLWDQSALEKLVRANLRFVVSVAKQYQNNGLTLSDLINEGNLGLIKAAQRFDETKWFKFISYAVWWIRQSILQALSETASLVRLPMNKVTVKNKANKIAEVFEQEHETTITNQELAELMGMSEYELSQILWDKRSFSLDAPLTDESDSITRGDLLVDQTAAQNEQHWDNRRLVEYVLTLNVLKDQEKDILRLFFGIGLQDPVALENIGEQINLTRERVRQIKDKAIEKLQSPHVKKLLQQRNAWEERKNRGSHIRSVSSPSHFGLAYLQQDPIEEDLNSKGDPEQVEDNTSFFSRDYPREIWEEPKKNTKPVRYSFRRPKTESPKDNIWDTSSTPKKPIKYNWDIQQDTDTVAEDNGINQFALKTLLYIQNMQVDFDEMIQDRDKHFPDIEYRDYQIEKVKKILQWFCNKELWKTDKLAVADITPPRGWKTILMAILAKLMRRQGIPSVISMWNAQAMDWPDNGLAVYHKFFSEDQIGMIDAYHKEYNKPITLITGTSFARHFGNLPKADHINIMLDEWDTFQTDLRQNALSKYNIWGKNFISMYSATTYLNGRDITDWADISDEMHLVDQIKLGFSKNIQWYYYTGDIELTDEKMIGDHMEYDLLHEAEKQWLQKAVVNICQLDTNKKTIVTCQNINQCKETKKMLQQAWFSVEYIVENTPWDERRRILESYIHDDLQVILHVQVLWRSFSDKGITQRVIQAVISGSPTRVYQNILRGTTPHNEYDVLEIYQLIPSTIKTRSFMPVLMHQCFGIALDEYERWIQIDDKRNVSWGQPISFVSHKKKKGTVDEKAGVVEFLSVERLQEVVNTRTLHKQYNDYIKEHFMELMKWILEKHKKTIFNIGWEELHDAYTTVRIGNSDMDISLYTIYSAVGVILFGDLGKTELRQTINPLIKKYIQERYVYGEIPLQASLETHWLTPADIQKLIKKVFRKKNLFTNEFLTKHALDILDIFIQEQDIKPERPDLYVGKHVTYQDLTLSYGQLLMSMLKQCGQVSHDIAHYNIKAASHILWSWKEKNKSPSVLETRRCIIEHVLEDNKNGYFRNNIKYIVESFLWAEGIDFTELWNISVQQEKKNTISISSTQVKEFLRIIWSEKYVELVQAESAYELNYEWRSMIISLVLSYFDVKWLKENKLAWSNVKNLKYSSCLTISTRSHRWYYDSWEIAFSANTRNNLS